MERVKLDVTTEQIKVLMNYNKKRERGSPRLSCDTEAYRDGNRPVLSVQTEKEASGDQIVISFPL